LILMMQAAMAKGQVCLIFVVYNKDDTYGLKRKLISTTA